MDQNQQPKTSVNNLLNQQLVLLRQSEQELESITTELNQERYNIDQILQQYTEEWTNHRKKYFEQLIKQLKDNNIVLSNIEQDELYQGSTTIVRIREKSETLKKLKIDLPSKASDFIIIVYDAIVAALSRTLQKIDDKTVKAIVKKLEVIDDENKAAKKLKTEYDKRYEAVIDKIKILEDKIAQVATLTPSQLDLLSNIKQPVKITKQKK